VVIIHTFEEISQGIFGLKIGPIKLSTRKYLVGASIISTLNLGTLFLIVSGFRLGLYLGIFTSFIFGIIQALVHAIGFQKAGRKLAKFGAGFYSSIPLAVVGVVLFYNILKVV
jgi:hypothetical protein